MSKTTQAAIWAVLGMNIVLIFLAVASQSNDKMYIDGLEVAREAAEAANQNWQKSNELIKAELDLKQKEIEVYEQNIKQINYQNSELSRLLRDQLEEIKEQNALLMEQQEEKATH